MKNGSASVEVPNYRLYAFDALEYYYITEWSTNCTAMQTIITHKTLWRELLAVEILLSSAS